MSPLLLLFPIRLCFKLPALNNLQYYKSAELAGTVDWKGPWKGFKEADNTLLLDLGTGYKGVFYLHKSYKPDTYPVCYLVKRTVLK